MGCKMLHDDCSGPLGTSFFLAEVRVAAHRSNSACRDADNVGSLARARKPLNKLFSQYFFLLGLSACGLCRFRRRQKKIDR